MRRSRNEEIFVKAISTARHIAVWALASAGLSGCFSTTPQWDEKVGDAINQIKAAQILHPAADQADAQPTTMDGAAAVQAQGQYLHSYETPPQPKSSDLSK